MNIFHWNYQVFFISSDRDFNLFSEYVPIANKPPSIEAPSEKKSSLYIPIEKKISEEYVPTKKESSLYIPVRLVYKLYLGPRFSVFDWLSLSSNQSRASF